MGPHHPVLGHPSGDSPAGDSREVWITSLQCVAVCCSVLQCVAVCCSVLRGVDHLITGRRRPIGCLISTGHFPTAL